MIPGHVYSRYVEDLLAGRRRACRAAVESLLAARTPIRSLHLDLFTESLHEVGRGWEAGRVSVVQEHAATAITEELLSLVFTAALAGAPAVWPAPAPTALVSCATNEQHHVGGRILADTLELRGWDTTFVGAGAPLDDLLRLVGQRRFDAIFLSVATLDRVGPALAAAARLRDTASGAVVVIGGGAFQGERSAAVTAVPHGVRLIRDLAELEEALPSLVP